MLTKELKRIIRKNWRAMRPSYYRNFHGHYDLHVRINARVILADTIQHYAENDVIGAVIDRTDCDMSRGIHGEIKSTRSLFALQRWIIDSYANWQEGHFSIEFVPPCQIPFAPINRDLALEAFEDGHPHVIYR